MPSHKSAARFVIKHGEMSLPFNSHAPLRTVDAKLHLLLNTSEKIDNWPTALRHQWWSTCFLAVLAIICFPVSADAASIKLRVKPGHVAYLLSGPRELTSRPYETAQQAFDAYAPWYAAQSSSSWTYEASNLRPCEGSSQSSFLWGMPTSWCHDYKVWYWGKLDHEGVTSVISMGGTCPSSDTEWWQTENLAPLPGTGSGGIPAQYERWCTRTITLNQHLTSSCGPEVTGNPVLADVGVKFLSESLYQNAAKTINFSHEYRSDAKKFSTTSYDVIFSQEVITQSENCLQSSARLYDQAQGTYFYRPFCFTRMSSAGDGSAIQIFERGGFIREYAWNENSATAIRPFETSTMERLPLESGDGWTRNNPEKMEIDIFDASGKVISKNHADGRIEALIYSHLATPATIGRNSDALVRLSDSFGRSLDIKYSQSGLLDHIVTPSGDPIGFSYEPATSDKNCTAAACFRLAALSYPNGDTRLFHYNEPTHTSGTNLPYALTGISDVDASGNETRYATYQYDASGRAISTGHAGGADLHTLDYVQPYKQTKVTDPLGTERTLNFTTIHGVVKLTNQSQPAGAGCNASTAALTYDPNGNVASRTGFDGTITTYTHDLTRNLETQRVEASGTADARTISTEWHPDWHLRSAQAEPKLITRWIYNGQSDPVSGGTASCAPSDAEVIEGMPIAVVCKKVEQPTTDTNGAAGFAATADGPARVWSYTYNRYGKVLTADGPRTDVADLWAYEYYAADATCPGAGEGTGMDKGCRGELLRATDPAGLVTDYLKYNAHGQLLEMRAPNGVVTTYAYDLRQRLTAQEVGGLLTSFDYDPRGLLERLTLPDGTAIDYTYDAAHRLTDITQAATGERIHYTLDAAGNRTAETVFDATGTAVRSLARNFDALGRLWKEVRSVNGQAAETVYLHDAEDRLTHATDPLTHTNQWQYNRLGQLKAEIDALNHTTALTPDAAGNTTAVQAANGATTQFVVNGLGEVAQESSPDRGFVGYEYDLAGNTISRTDNSGTRETTYDAAGRPIMMRTLKADGSEAWRVTNYTWDTAPNGAGQVARLAGPDATLDWAYDSLGRVSSHTQTLGTVALTLGTAYDTDGRLQSLTYPSGRVLQLAYDSAGRVSSLAFTPYQIASNIAYHPFGGIRSITLLNGIVHHRGQDTNGWPQGYTLGEQPLDFGYDLAGRITGLDQNGTAYDQGFGYDAADRLTSYTGHPALRAYTYDANANRTSETLGAMITSITHVAGTNRIHKVGTQAMAFDAAGNLSSYAGKTFTHGADGRLRSSTTSTGTVTYHYDGLGRRVSKSGPATLVPGGFVRYAYDAAHHLIGEYKADGSPIKEYVWLGDLPVAVIHTNPDNTTTAYAIEADHLGTPRLLTDATRAPRWRWTSTPFGEVLPEDDPSGLGAVTFNLRFPGQYYDKETGLHYNWNRYYDPRTGRYVQSDPIGLAGGWNTYAYVGGNPISRIDPLGLEWQATIGIGASLGGNPILPLPGIFGGGGVSIGFTSSGQIIVQAQATGSVGSGVYGGVGVQGQISKSKCPTKSGMSVGQSLQGDFNFGAGPSVGGSIQYDGNGGGGLSTGIGRAGVGFGLQASGGVTQTLTIATPALFSSSSECGCPQ